MLWILPTWSWIAIRRVVIDHAAVKRPKWFSTFWSARPITITNLFVWPTHSIWNSLPDLGLGTNWRKSRTGLISIHYNRINKLWMDGSRIVICIEWSLLIEHFGYCHQSFALCLIFLLLHVGQLFIFVLNNNNITFIWFLVFFGKNELKIWKSVPYLFNKILKVSTYSSVQILDFSLNYDSTVWLLEIESVSLIVFFFFAF